jgi:hypothetical protein
MCHNKSLLPGNREPRHEQVVPDGFESLYERFTTRRVQSESIDEGEQSELSKEEEQLGILEDLRVQGTREL